MAGVPCFNDTCSTVATVDGFGRMSIDARLNPNGGLVCVDGLGLGLANIPNHVVFADGSSDRQAIPAGTTVDTTMVLTNPTASPVLVVADMRFDFRFTYLAAGNDLDDRYYSFDIGHDLLLDGLSVLGGGAFAETIDGIGPRNDAGSDQRAKARKSAAVFTLIPGVHSLTMRSSRSANGAGTVGTITATPASNGVSHSIRLAALGLTTGNTVVLA